MISRLHRILLALMVLAAPVAAQETTLVVQPGAPTLDGVISEGEWTSESLVTQRGVTLRAMADGLYLYVAATWADETQDDRRNLLTYSGSRWSRTEDEDRFAMLFDMGLTGSDGANCQAFCHFPGMNTNGGTVDVWQWRAARSNPMGISDDTYWDETGQLMDDGVTAVLLNDLGSTTRLPEFMAASDPGAIAEFLVQDAAALDAFDPYGVLDGRKVDTAVAYDSGVAFAADDQIPGHVLRVPSGDVADVNAAGRYSEGTWTVEFKKPYAGGDHDFAVQPGSSVEFVHEVFDNQGSDHAIDATPVDPTIYTLDFSMITGVAVEPIAENAPYGFRLMQNYPNPFQETTSIEFQLSAPEQIRLDVVDVHGKVVRTLLDRLVEPGTHRLLFEAGDLASGLYFYRIAGESFSDARHMVLLR